jgi:hypothetical protein
MSPTASGQTCVCARRNLSITSDIIVGFPTETTADFRETLSLVEEVGKPGAGSENPQPGSGLRFAIRGGYTVTRSHHPHQCPYSSSRWLLSPDGSGSCMDDLVQLLD